MARSHRYRRPRPPGRSSRLQLSEVAIPTDVPNMTVIFIIMRRMRGPLLMLITIMTFGVIGLSQMPGLPQPDGSDGRLTALQAFYVFSYTATSIGYGEVPHEFSVYQRWWIVGSIYMSVIGWFNTITRLMSLLQDPAYQAARAAQAARRTISNMREPFTIIVGYGYIGRTVTRALDRLGRRVVVVDLSSPTVTGLATDLLTEEVPGVCGDARNPSVLGLAGLDNPFCEAVITVTGDEEVNLQVVMSCALLRPKLPVITRASTRRMAEAMADFSPAAILNPFDDYGDLLVRALQHPCTYRLITWLMSEEGTDLPPLETRSELQSTKWLVISDGAFGEEISRDLTKAGYDVSFARPNDELDYTGVAAVIAGAESDTTNLALAAHLRHDYPDIFIAVRQQSHARLPLLHAFRPDSVFFPPQLVAQRAVANLITPRLWAFVEHLMDSDEAYSKNLTNRLVERVGTHAPIPVRTWIGPTQTPTVARWLRHRPLALGALFRSPQDWNEQIAVFPLLLIRGGKTITLPDEEMELEIGDELLMLGTRDAFNEQSECLQDDSTLFYTATGRDIPTSQAWRRLTGQRWKDAFPVDDAMEDT